MIALRLILIERPSREAETRSHDNIIIRLSAALLQFRRLSRRTADHRYEAPDARSGSGSDPSALPETDTTKKAEPKFRLLKTPDLQRG